MKLTVVAATGGIGRQLLTQAVAAGHDVTAVARNPKAVTSDVRLVTVDLASPDQVALESAVDGADAVLSGLGARTAADIGIAARGTEALVEAMQVKGARRIIVVSSAAVSTVPSPGRPHPPRHDPGDDFFARRVLYPMLKSFLRKRYEDLALMEDVMRDSGLDWTIMRPTRLTNRSMTGGYRTALGNNVRGGTSISRADVAHCMLRAVHQPETIKETVCVAY